MKDKLYKQWKRVVFACACFSFLFAFGLFMVLDKDDVVSDSELDIQDELLRTMQVMKQFGIPYASGVFSFTYRGTLPLATDADAVTDVEYDVSYHVDEDGVFYVHINDDVYQVNQEADRLVYTHLRSDTIVRLPASSDADTLASSQYTVNQQAFDMDVRYTRSIHVSRLQDVHAFLMRMTYDDLYYVHDMLSDALTVLEQDPSRVRYDVLGDGFMMHIEHDDDTARTMVFSRAKGLLRMDGYYRGDAMHLSLHTLTYEEEAMYQAFRGVTEMETDDLTP